MRTTAALAKIKDHPSVSSASPKKSEKVAAANTIEPLKSSSREKNSSPKKAAAAEKELQKEPKMPPQKAARSKASPARIAEARKRSPAKAREHSPNRSAKRTSKASSISEQAQSSSSTTEASLKEDMARKLQPTDEDGGSPWKAYSTEEILDSIDKRTLTKLDRALLKAIAQLESGSSSSFAELPYEDGNKLNGHYHIFRRFHHLNNSGPGEVSSEGGRSVSKISNDKVKSSMPTRSRARSKSPAKGVARASPSKRTKTLSKPPVLSPSKNKQSPQTVQRPYHSPTSQKSPVTPSRRTPDDGRVQKNRTRPTPSTIGYLKGHRSDAKEVDLKKVKKRASENYLADREQEKYSSSSAARHGIELSEFKKAQREGIAGAESQIERSIAQESLRKVDQTEQGFNESDTDDLQPDELPRQSPSPGKAAAGQTPKRGTVRSPRKTAPKSPATQLSIDKELEERKRMVDGQTSFGPEKENRGRIFSSTNPPIITVEGKERVNPFFETMPAPEVWHRRMPPYFMFGETKYMEQKLSDQINADLKRTHNEPTSEKPKGSQSPSRGLLGKALDGVGSLKRAVFGGQGAPEAPEASVKPKEKTVVTPPRDDPWALPPLRSTPNAPRAVSAKIAGSTKRKPSQSGGPSAKRSKPE